MLAACAQFNNDHSMKKTRCCFLCLFALHCIALHFHQFHCLLLRFRPEVQTRQNKQQEGSHEGPADLFSAVGTSWDLETISDTPAAAEGFEIDALALDCAMNSELRFVSEKWQSMKLTEVMGKFRTREIASERKWIEPRDLKWTADARVAFLCIVPLLSPALFDRWFWLCWLCLGV